MQTIHMDAACCAQKGSMLKFALTTCRKRDGSYISEMRNALKAFLVKNAGQMQLWLSATASATAARRLAACSSQRKIVTY